MEIKEIYIKNFRNIGEEGAEIKLSPITIFTGCNSAGKSTAAKVLLLLEAYLSDVKANNYNLIDTTLDFSKVVKLGTFDTVLNASAKANGQDFFVLGYSFESVILVADIRVRLTFKKKDSDALNNAWLQEMTILIDSTELFSIQIIDGHYFLEIKDKEKLIEYIRCYKIRHIVSLCREYDSSRSEREEWRRISEINPQPIGDEWAKIRAYIPAIKNIERQLVSENIMRGTLSEEKRDRTFKEIPSSKDIISAIENIVEFESIWMKAYKIELDNKKRFSMDDLNRILESKRQDYKKDFDQLKKLKSWPPFDDFWKEEISNTEEAFRLYVDSDSKNIIEYKKGRNYIVLDNIIDKINNSDFQLTAMSLAGKRGKGLGILGLFNTASNPIGDACTYLLDQSLNPYLLGRVGYVDASTVEVRRLYPLDFSDRFGNLWKRFNEEKPRRQYSNPIEKGDFLRKWLREFQICDDIVVENIEGALKIKLISSSMPDGRLLADYGYGVTQLIALLLNIEIAINNAEDGPVIDMVEEYGQLDVLIGTIPYLLILEEPEIHLHPSLQSRLADMFLDAEKHGVHFIIETHSEYLVRRTQVIVASIFSKNPKYIPKFRVYYFPADSKPYDMGYQTNGYFKESFGTGFLDEAGKWTRELMRTNRR